MAKPTLEIFTGSKSLGSVFKEQIQINVKFTDFNIPFTTTAGHVQVQWKGKTRIIMVQGAHDGNGFDGATQEDKLGDFVYEMEEWVQGNVDASGAAQSVKNQSSAVYTDSLGTAYNVYCLDWTWTRSFSDPNRVLYTLILVE